MSFIIGLTVAMLFLEWPWRWLVILPTAFLEAFEIMLWLRWRKVRSITGAEGIIGAVGHAVTDCRPEGQVKVNGQLWKARCGPGVSGGAEIEVIRVSGIELEVAPR